MASDRREIELHVSAFPDGTTYIVTIEEPATGRKQVIEGIVADSTEDAIERVTAILERNAKAAMGDAAHVSRGPIITD
jgi:hypothetical protein